MHLLLIAFRSLLQHRRRSLLLGGAITLVTVLLLLLIALVGAAQSGLFDMFTTLYSGHVNIEGFYKPTAGRSEFAVTDSAKLKALVHQDVPEATTIISRGRGWARAISPQTSFQLAPIGVDIAHDPQLSSALHPLEGSVQDLGKPGGMVLFQSGAKRLAVTVGDPVTLSAKTLSGVYNNVDLTVVAVVKDLGPFSEAMAFIPEPALRELYGQNDDTTGVLMIYLKDPSAASTVAVRLRKELTQAGYQLLDPDPRIYFMKSDKVNSEDWKGQRLDITTYEDSMSLLKWVVMLLRGLSVGVVGILLVVIVVGVMNTLWISLWERTREIGALRAIGMGRKSVLAMVSAEALLLSAMATTLGSVIGWTLCAALTHAQLPIGPPLSTALVRDHLSLHVGLLAPLLVVVGITGFTTLMSLVPGMRAARLSPLVAMQHTT